MTENRRRALDYLTRAEGYADIGAPDGVALVWSNMAVAYFLADLTDPDGSVGPAIEP